MNCDECENFKPKERKPLAFADQLKAIKAITNGDCIGILCTDCAFSGSGGQCLKTKIQGWG